MTQTELIDLVIRRDQEIDRLMSNVDNKVLHEKMLILEEELCMKNKLLNELQHEIQHETNSSVIEPQFFFDENLSRISASSASSDDSIEILQECLSIASKNVSSLMKIKSEPVVEDEVCNPIESLNLNFSQESIDTDNSTALDISINTSTPVHPKIISTKSLSKPGKETSRSQRSKKKHNNSVGNIVDNLLDEEALGKGDQSKNTSLPLETPQMTKNPRNKNTRRGRGTRSKVSVASSNSLSSWLSASSTPINEPKKSRKRKREDDPQEKSEEVPIKLQPFASLCAKWSNIFKHDFEG